jgi:predicted NAD-dependent protein-ADP-ribosyltransferase YbiA (DUF1768 family)
MLTPDIAEQKRLGSQVKVNPDEWEKKSPELMHIGLIAKFAQNEKL